MQLDLVADRGLHLLGCGKMGSALLEGWLARGLPPACVSVQEPSPSARLRTLAAEGLRLNAALAAPPAVAVLAVKPQAIDAALPGVARFGRETLFLSIAAGIPLARFEAALGAEARVVRAMPNTPAAIGRGITALVGNTAASGADLDLAESLLCAVGQTIRLASEAEMDAVTAVSGSGPAYLFLLIETLAAAGEAEGLDPETALRLARATVAGAGALAEADPAHPSELRVNVTSPGGTTAAALDHLMEPEHGLRPLIRRAVAAAAARSRELGRG